MISSRGPKWRLSASWIALSNVFIIELKMVTIYYKDIHGPI